MLIFVCIFATNHIYIHICTYTFTSIFVLIACQFIAPCEVSEGIVSLVSTNLFSHLSVSVQF